jgi:hypothetical protein
MTIPPGLNRAPVASFDRIDSLTDPAVLSALLGDVREIRLEPLAYQRERNAFRKDDWDWWVARQSAWSAR